MAQLFQRPQMASTIATNTLQQKHLFSISHCKYPTTLNTLKFQFLSEFLTSLPPKHTLKLRSSPIFVLHNIQAKLHTKDRETSSKTLNSRSVPETGTGFKDKRVVENPVETIFSSLVRDKSERRFIKDRSARKNVGFKQRRENPSLWSKDDNKAFKTSKNVGNLVAHEKVEKKTKMGGGNNQVMEEKTTEKKSKSKKIESPEVQLKVNLDMCSKTGDVMSAIQIYDAAQREGIKLEQYHYTVLLYLCSSAAVGVVRPNKSGSGSRTLNALDFSIGVSRVNSLDVGERNSDAKKSDSTVSKNGLLIDIRRNQGNVAEVKLNSSRQLDDLGKTFNGKEISTQFSDRFTKLNSDRNTGGNVQEDKEMMFSEDFKSYALERGFEIYEEMCLSKVPMNEATLTAVARLAMSVGNGDMAFDMVKQMKPLGINPRLRSYGPALSAFCSRGDVDKAFTVEKHMLEHGVYPEEPELQALLRVSVAAGKGDKVYYVLHKLRTSLRKVLPSTADIIIKWFESKTASRVGKTKWDRRQIKAAIKNGGGGWHGQGWLGKGKWTVSHSIVGPDALCKCCGEKLSIIDLDPVETENFAESVASIAIKRERNSSFQKFQKWLDYYGPFEAVIDAANVGLFSQKKFMPSKVNAIVNAIRQKLPSKKWPLIVLHNRRLTGHKMDQPINKSLIEKWRNADALYATPSGSNDDWYWLYAAIKFKCLIVTNDEMRDHTFQLLGNDFFPKWKERHLVHFSISDSGPVFHMPPPCSIVIQESENGHWHIPIASEDSEQDHGLERTWLCIARANSSIKRKDAVNQPEVRLNFVKRQSPDHSGAHAGLTSQSKAKIEPQPLNYSYQENTPNSPQEIYKSVTSILSESVYSNHRTVLSEIEDAERLGNCVIDFQI